jgi:cytochrome c5
MKSLIKQTLLAASLTLAACALATAAPKKPSKAKQKTEVTQEAEPDVAGSTTIDLSCEHGNSVTLFQSAGDDEHMALRWNKHIHRLTRVGTSTGADRFENTNAGLVWIGIPAKGMLLDSKGGHQLANECRTAEQMQAMKNGTP